MFDALNAIITLLNLTYLSNNNIKALTAHMVAVANCNRLLTLEEDHISEEAANTLYREQQRLVHLLNVEPHTLTARESKRLARRLSIVDKCHDTACKARNKIVVQRDYSQRLRESGWKAFPTLHECEVMSAI